MVLSRVAKLSLAAVGAAGVGAGALYLDKAVFGYAGPLSGVQRALAISPEAANVGLRVVATGFSEVTDVQFVPWSDKSAIVLMKGGTARYLTLAKNISVSAQDSPIVFSVDVMTDIELGLLGLAFHPDYLNNGLFYVNYNPKGERMKTRVSEWFLDKKRLGHEKAIERRVILEVEQPFANHNAGQLAFGPDGMLYVGMGDGGKRADPLKAGQDPTQLLGKMLRIDVDQRSGDKEYAVPPDNPFVTRKDFHPEVWAYGLRNPWRYSFDERGRLIVGDVGQDEHEELDVVEPGDNLGWVVREGRHCFPPGATCTDNGFKDPVFEYPRTEGKSITAGYVYLGKTLPALVGKFIVADYVSGNVWSVSLPKTSKDAADATLLGTWPRSISTFGRNASGEVFAGDFRSGELLAFVPRRAD